MKTVSKTEMAGGTWPSQTFETAVLVLLKDAWSHGYELRDRLQDLGMAAADLSRLYRTLHRLEREGAITSRWETEGPRRGPARHVYTLTRQGSRHLRQRIEALRANTDVMQRIGSQYVRLAGDVA